MTVELRIPEAGESITEVQIAEWKKAEGDSVERDEVLVEIETDKASMELPAPVSGTIEKILKTPGQLVGVGEVIARIKEADGKAAAKPAREQKPAREKAKAPEAPPAPKAPARRAEAAEEAPEEHPEVVAEAAEEGRESETSAAKPREEDQSPRRARNEVEERAKPPVEEEEEEEEELEPGEEEEEEDEDLEIEVQPRVMPAARRALAEYGLTATDVRGTGPGGRVLKDDVLRHVARAEAPKKQERPAPTSKDPRAIAAAAPVDQRDTVTPMSMLRRRVAERLVDAQQTAALLTTFNELDMSEVLRFRKQNGEVFQQRHGIKLGFMSFFVKAATDTLRAFPQVNAEIRGTDIVYHKYYDVGVAVATDQGLVVPVLRDADQMSFAEIEKAIEDMARRARDRRITVEELRGGTFTITNGGVFGSLLSTPIVNPPQSAILGLHTIQDRPVAREGQVVIRPMMYLALTYDHRLIDGREAVMFLRHIKESVESPVRMLLGI